ncbi:hypothetical protein VNI00_007553 [Paramarasmius palmivorus]|uniref:Mtf2-like C-terminal domain-containing protein n=1 Tax=Paramarasmius palmivorus TaxID=297713 RepID=A0AAW0D2C0_9AGAR
MPATLRNPLSTSRRPRRQKMTAREISAFDDMFNMIFDAVAEQKNGSSHAEKTPGIAIGGNTGLSDLFGKLRRHSRAMKWTTEEEELLDKKKEEMDLCDTDQQLLDWAMKEVFGESERYERESREAMEEVTKNGGSSKMVLPMLQPPTYPHLLALIMRTFRDKYHDPNLTLSMFDYARHLSIPSYVFGCSTAVYNELLETRWRCFQDLRGVHDALEEMSVNGVDVDNNTRKIVERVRREVGERTLWEEDDLGNGQTWSMLEKIEKLTVPRHSKSKRRSSKKAVTGKPAKWDDWKNEGDKSDGWEFDSWDKPGKMR